MPLELPGLDPLAPGAGDEAPGAVGVEHRAAVLALAGRVQVERVHWLLVLADLADEPSARADEARGHVFDAQPHRGGQGLDELAGVELLDVRQTVDLGVGVEILPRPDDVRQGDLDTLLTSFGTGAQISREVDQLLPKAVGTVNNSSYLGQIWREAVQIYNWLGRYRLQEEEGRLGDLVEAGVPVVEHPGGDGGEVGVGVAVVAVVLPGEVAQARRPEHGSDGFTAVLAPPVLLVEAGLVTDEVQTPGEAEVLGEGQRGHPQVRRGTEAEAVQSAGAVVLLRNQVAAADWRLDRVVEDEVEPRSRGPRAAHPAVWLGLVRGAVAQGEAAAVGQGAEAPRRGRTDAGLDLRRNFREAEAGGAARGRGLHLVHLRGQAGAEDGAGRGAVPLQGWRHGLRPRQQYLRPGGHGLRPRGRQLGCWGHSLRAGGHHLWGWTCLSHVSIQTIFI